MARFGFGVSPFCALVVSFLLIPPAAPAQVTSPSDFVQAPIPGAGHDYINLLSETVNPADGSVNLDFKLPTPKGRGVSFPFSLTYNSGALLHFANFAPNYSAFVPNGPWSSGWRTSLPYLTFTNTAIGIPYGSGDCYFSTGYEFYDLAGKAHDLYMSVDSPSPESQGQGSDCSSLGSQIPSFVSDNFGGDSQVKASFTVYCGDGAYDSGQSTTCNNAEPPVAVFDAAGRIYSFNTGVFIGYPFISPNNSTQVTVWPNSIEDRNGNLISFSGASVMDTAGRTVVSLNNNTSPTVVSAGGLTYNLAYSPASFGYSIPVESIPPPDGITNPSGTTCAWATGELTQALLGTSPTTVSTLTLPNNKSYSFTYDPTYGVLSEIVYPDGGWVKYTWGFPSTYSTNALFSGLLSTGGPWPDGCNFLYSTPVVATRQVGFGGSTTPVLTQTFSYSTTWGTGTSNDSWTAKTTTVTTTDKITNRVKQTTYTYSSINIPPAPGFSDTGAIGSQIPVEQTVQDYDWGNTTSPIRTDAKVWYDQFNLKSQQTTIGTQTSEVTYVYGFGGAVTQKNEYDFGSGGPGALLRQTVTNYQAFPVNPLFEFPSVYSSSTLLTSPCQTIVYDGNNNRYAETDYFYDNGATGTVCGTAGTPSVTAVSPALVAGTTMKQITRQVQPSHAEI
jgi:hypothetical protein